LTEKRIGASLARIKQLQYWSQKAAIEQWKRIDCGKEVS